MPKSKYIIGIFLIFEPTMHPVRFFYNSSDIDKSNTQLSGLVQLISLKTINKLVKWFD